MKKIEWSKEISFRRAGMAEGEVVSLEIYPLKAGYGIKDLKVGRKQKQLQPAIPISNTESKARCVIVMTILLCARWLQRF